MKYKRTIQREVQLAPDILEGKINNYLKKNFYRITDRGDGYIIFIDDEFSDRKSSRSDVHTRIGEGKFEFYANAQGTFVKLIYLTPVLFPVFLMSVFAAFGAYIGSIGPIIVSFAFAIPLVVREYYLKGNVFKDVLES